MTGSALAGLYSELGLVRAARAVHCRLDTREPLEGEARWALSSGDYIQARELARDLVKRFPSMSARLLLGRALLGMGEFSGARFQFVTVLNGSRTTPMERASALGGRAQVAAQEGDDAGASAAACAAVSEVFQWVCRAGGTVAVDESVLAIDVALRRAASLAEGAEIESRIAELGEPACTVMMALWTQAKYTIPRHRIAAGDVEVALGTAVAAAPDSAILAHRHAEIVLECAELSHQAEAAGELEQQILRVVRGRVDVDVGAAWARAGAGFTRAGDEIGAVRCYRQALAWRPGLEDVRVQLSRLCEDSNALAVLEGGLRLHAGAASLWREVLERDLPAAGTTTMRHGGVVAGAWDLGRTGALEGMYARGHRLKNLLGIFGSRARRLGRACEDSELSERLSAFEGELRAAYDEWAMYLRSLHTEPSDDISSLADILRVAARTAQQSGSAQVHLEPPDDAITVRGDRVLLIEAFTNIAVNAVQACEGAGQGRVAIRVSTTLRADGRVAVVSIRDTGVGMAPELRARIFSPGFTTKGSGSGLGLVIAERVVRAQRGSISVQSTAGEGTTVDIVLPCQAVE